MLENGLFECYSDLYNLLIINKFEFEAEILE